MGEHMQYRNGRHTPKDYYDREEKLNSVSSHLYVAHKETNLNSKRDEMENCEADTAMEYTLLTKLWSLRKFDFDVVVIHELEKQFNELAIKWKEETGLFSTVYQKIVHDLYFEIVALGKDIVPFILKDLENNGPSHWHTALKALTRENPVSDEDLK